MSSTTKTDAGTAGITADAGRASLDDLIAAINEAVSHGEGALGPANLVHEIERKGLMLVDDRDPAGTAPNNETLIWIIIDVWNDAMMDGMGEFSKHRFEYQLKRHDLFLINVNPCVLGKCSSPWTCNDFSECDVNFARADRAALSAASGEKSNG